MGYYLTDHPNPRYPQTRPRSAWGWDKPTGLVTVHTAEGALDRIAPDAGAENVAAFIATRSDAGGYHVLVDTDSTIDMAPDDVMTWHTAAYNLNGPGWGVSAACRSTEWDPDAEWTRQIIARMGQAIAAFWRRQGHDVAASARWLSHDQVRAAGGRIVGLIHHGVIQPGDRSDAWALHPQRWRLDAMLLAAIVDKAPNPRPTPTPPSPEEDIMVTRAENQADMAAAIKPVNDRLATLEQLVTSRGSYIARDERDGAMWLVAGDVKRLIPDPASVDVLKTFLPERAVGAATLDALPSEAWAA